MFRRHGFFRFLLIGFLFISLFGLIRGLAYRSGWAQGFAAGQTAADAPPAGEGEDAPPATQAPHYGPRWGGGLFSPFFWIVGGFFKFFLFLFLFGLIFKLFCFGRWRRRHSHKEWKHHHRGHTPPWYDDSGEEPIMKA
jgi:hypothetical protein